MTLKKDIEIAFKKNGFRNIEISKMDSKNLRNKLTTKEHKHDNIKAQELRDEQINKLVTFLSSKLGIKEVQININNEEFHFYYRS